ncbi:MAG: polyisoprenoid-binding protein [Bacteroidetes bacterium]|nr:MAG: polyisoprenoid-binding protein [Bacteroidota bacterium]
MSTTTLSQHVWAIDPSHSEIQFKVRHMVISTVTGSFGTFEAQLTSHGDDFEGAQVTFSADIDSIQTGQAPRDGHLKSADFFDAANHPKLTFVSTSFTKTGEDTYEVSGDLTIRGTTLPVTLSAEYGGSNVDPYGNHRAGFELSGKISRQAFGLVWSAVTEAGAIVVSDDVRLSINASMIRQ